MPGAEEWYSLVLVSEGRMDCDWAEPSALFCRWMREKDPADLERLALCAAAELLYALLKRVPRHDFCFFEHALVCAMAWLPGLSDEIHDEMRQRRKQLEAE